MSNPFPHSRRYHPPLPTLTVKLRATAGNGGSTVEMSTILDTGADI